MKHRHEWQRSTYRRRMIKYFYSITLEEFAEQEQLQGGKCGLCKRIPPSGQRLRVDHVHGLHSHQGSRRGCPECIRGLVCNNCNRSVIPVLEKSEHLQNDFVEMYFSSRPFLDRKC